LEHKLDLEVHEPGKIPDDIVALADKVTRLDMIQLMLFFEALAV
jgi:hypothetical protein